jgi:hypothetical protein
MSLFYSLAYRFGITPWEEAATHPPAARLELAFRGWRIVDDEPFDATGLPAPLRNVDPRVYRFRRA